MREAAELAQPTEHYHAAPLEENLFEWHFTGSLPPNSATCQLYNVKIQNCRAKHLNNWMYRL